jgi:hypothetical protein
MRKAIILHRPRRGRVHIAVLAATVLSSANAWAGRPLVTEDAGVLAGSVCEWESFSARQLDPSVTLGTTQIGCGIGSNTQLAVGTSRERNADTASRYTILAGKTAVGNGGDDLPRMAVAYTLLSGGEQTDYLDYGSAEIKGVLDIPYGVWCLHANAGLLQSHQERARRIT